MTTLHIPLGETGEWPEAFLNEMRRASNLRFNTERALRYATAKLFPKHVMLTHEDHCPEALADRTCMICDGGLSMCVICGGGEASLPTECPGYRMGGEMQQRIMDMTLDWVDGHAVVCTPVWFHNHAKAVPFPSWCAERGERIPEAERRPALDGYAFTHVPAKINGYEWAAEKLP